MVAETRVTWAISVPILVFLCLSVLELHPMYATDVRQNHSLMPPPYMEAEGRGIITTVVQLLKEKCVRYQNDGLRAEKEVWRYLQPY